MKQAVTFYEFITQALNIKMDGYLVDLKHKFKYCEFNFGLLNISFKYFDRIDLICADKEKRLWFGKDYFAVIITKDKFEYLRRDEESEWQVIKRIKRKKHMVIDIFLETCALILKELVLIFQNDILRTKFDR